LGQQCHHAFWVVDYYPLNYFSWASSATMLFESWILIPRTISLGPAVPPCFLGHQRRLVVRVVDFDSSNLFFSACSAANLPEYWISISRVTSFEIITYPCAMGHVAHLVRLFDYTFHNSMNSYIQAISAITVTLHGL
jgi:hypothetical protein